MASSSSIDNRRQSIISSIEVHKMRCNKCAAPAPTGGKHNVCAVGGTYKSNPR